MWLYRFSNGREGLWVGLCVLGQKSFYYYIEFIGQIGDSNHQFLQLNSKDATLFVFKKTVFEINSDHRKIFSSPIGNDDFIIGWRALKKIIFIGTSLQLQITL